MNTTIKTTFATLLLAAQLTPGLVQAQSTSQLQRDNAAACAGKRRIAQENENVRHARSVKYIEELRQRFAVQTRRERDAAMRLPAHRQAAALARVEESERRRQETIELKTDRETTYHEEKCKQIEENESLCIGRGR
jgi:hypothetical protein